VSGGPTVQNDVDCARAALALVPSEGPSMSRWGRPKHERKTGQVSSPDHPISIQRNPARVVVSVAGRVVADTRNALTLREAAYPPVQYFQVRTLISPSWNGRITLPTVRIKAIAITTAFRWRKKSVNAVWSYEDPFPAVAADQGHVAFYPDRVDEIAEQLPTTGESSKSSRS